MALGRSGLRSGRGWGFLMSIPKWDASKQEATITMMELRQQPGECMDFVIAGGTLHITRQGKNIATIAPHQDSFFERFAAARSDLVKNKNYD